MARLRSKRSSCQHKSTELLLSVCFISYNGFMSSPASCRSTNAPCPHIHAPTTLRSPDTDTVVNKTANPKCISSQHALSELLTSKTKTEVQAAVLFYVNILFHSLYSSPFALTFRSLETRLFQTSKTYDLH